MIANAKVLSDPQIRVISTSAASTASGAAQAKGTATDLKVIVLAGPDGTTAIAGSVTLQVQGSNSTVGSTFVNVSPDKGSFSAVTASGQQVVHFAQLQSAYYRLSGSCTTTATADLAVVWNFESLQDSVDQTVA